MSQDSYHHGDLPAALLRAVREIVAEQGVGGVSVRAVARRAGVSHAAPAHHFRDRGGLIAALAAEGFELFVTEMRAAVLELPEDATVADAFDAMGERYIAFGLRHPEYYRVMFRPELVDSEDPGLEQAGGHGFGAVVAVARASLAPDAPDDEVLEVAVTAWATVHGFVSLAHELPTMRGEYLPVVTGMADGVRRTLLDGLRAHPSWVGDDVPASALDPDLTDPAVSLPSGEPA